MYESALSLHKRIIRDYMKRNKISGAKGFTYREVFQAFYAKRVYQNMSAEGLIYALDRMKKDGDLLVIMKIPVYLNVKKKNR